MARHATLPSLHSYQYDRLHSLGTPEGDTRIS